MITVVSERDKNIFINRVKTVWILEIPRSRPGLHKDF
jgi:hypothetical protein